MPRIELEITERFANSFQTLSLSPISIKFFQLRLSLSEKFQFERRHPV